MDRLRASHAPFARPLPKGLLLPLFPKWHPERQRLASPLLSLSTISTVIAACDRGGAWDVALMVLDEAREGEGTANVFAYTAAISACGKSGHWEKAVSLLEVILL